MTKVQESTLPPILSGRDVVARAKTGSGKTVAFLLPMLERLDGTSDVGLVISPTREPAQ